MTTILSITTITGWLTALLLWHRARRQAKTLRQRAEIIHMLRQEYRLLQKPPRLLRPNHTPYNASRLN